MFLSLCSLVICANNQYMIARWTYSLVCTLHYLISSLRRCFWKHWTNKMLVRKWSLVIHGLDGGASEDGEVTRQTCKDFAKTVLKVEDAEATIFSACRRLSQRPNAGITIRFVDLAQWDRWLSVTKHLKNYNKKILISPDLPPMLRSLEDELKQTRAQLPAQQKPKSRVRFIPQCFHKSLKLTLGPAWTKCWNWTPFFS